MSVLYCYALLDRAPPGRRPRGLRGEPVRMLRGPGFVLAAGAMAEAPAVTARALRAHDAAVRRLAAASGALLPFRFGALLAGRREFLERFRPAAGAVRDALGLVGGREQMTLRIAGGTGRRRPTEPATPAGAGPGARYLHGRAGHALAESDLPDLQALRPALAGMVAAERVEARPAGDRLRASVYHLIPRGRAAVYRRAVRAALGPAGARRVAVSGPWPPYAFATGVVG